MTMVKSLVLGSAAALLAMGGAQAADLPVKAKAVEYVRICSLYGAGFWYIPGTDTCIKIGGYLRVDTTFNGGIYGAPFWNGGGGAGDRFTDRFNDRSRMALTVDTRTATEYGVVRTFAQSDWQFNNFGSTNPNAIGAAPAALGGLSGSVLDGVGGGYVGVEYVFLQFAGFTFGKSSSAYATPWNGYPGNNNSYLIGGNNSVTGVNNIQYTAQFGNGVSGSIGLDDPSQFNRTPLWNLGPGFGPALGGPSLAVATNGYGGMQLPDLVGNIRVDQAWGLFQLSGALHEVNASYNTLAFGGAPTTASILSGHPESKVGGSVMVALQIKNLPTGAGDDIKFDASWSKGDTKNVISTSGASPSFLMFGGVPGQGGPSGSLGFGATTDGVYLPGAGNASGLSGDGSIHLTEAFGVRGAFNHNWDPYWSTSLWGGAGWVRYDGTAAAELCGTFGVVVPGRGVTYTCDPNFSVWMIGVVTRWTPVKNLTFSGEVGFIGLHQNFSGSAIFTPGAPQPVQTWTFHDQSTAYLNVRVQRNF